MIAYGARCTWWDVKSKVGISKNPAACGTPCCPHCGGMLFEIDEETWMRGLDDCEKKDPGYKELIKWAQGKCFPSIDIARNEYHEDRLNKLEKELQNG